MKLLLACVCLALCARVVFMGRLTINETHFVKDGERVFLSGGNQAWIAYGEDFGDGNYGKHKAEFEKYLKLVHDNGGNSIRVWIHVEGVVSPHFDSNGYVTGLDKAGTFIAEFKEYLAKAQSYGIYIFPCLWNGAVDNHAHLHGLIKDTSKLQSYLDKALIPWVKAVMDDPALGGWDIINEFEGVLIPGEDNKESCFDTTFLQNSGAGWAGETYSAQELLQFINWQVDAIRRTDPGALVTAGSWNARDNTDEMKTRNLYSDTCLRKAGGKQQGVLTFYSSHSYPWKGKYDRFSPFKHNASDFDLGKPFVIAEFNSGGGMDIVDDFNHAYENGYAGAWSWQLHPSDTETDTSADQLRGMKALMGNNDQTKGGLIAVKL